MGAAVVLKQKFIKKIYWDGKNGCTIPPLLSSSPTGEVFYILLPLGDQVKYKRKGFCMKTYEALKECIHGHVHAVAKAVRKNIYTVYKWTEPHEDYSDSGNHNPLDSIEEIILAAINDGQDFHKAISPIKYLCYKFDLVCCKISHSNKSVKSTFNELMKTIKDFGQLCETIGKSLEDNIITKYELNEIGCLGLNLISQIMVLIKQAEKEAK